MDRDQDRKRRYSQDEMNEILDAAARLDDLSGEPAELTLDEVAQIGAELGSSPDAVREVVTQREAERAAEAAERAAAEAAIAHEEAERARQWRRWRASVARFVPMAAFFFILDLVTGGGLTWFWWPLLGIGIALIGQTTRLLMRADPEERPDGP